MSWTHKYLIGHFDPLAFDSRWPATLRHIDVDRARQLLKSMCSEIPDDLISEALVIDANYVEVEWSAVMRFRDDVFRYACRVADEERCLVVNVPPECVVYPTEIDLLDGPISYSLTQDEAESAVTANRLDDLRELLHRLPRANEIRPWAYELCVRLALHEHFHVRGNTMYAASLLPRKERTIFQPLIERGLDDDHAYVRQQAEAAARRTEVHLRWVYPYFDNGQPEIEAVTYSNGWILCDNCGWRFSTSDPRSFREGRCMECRQRIRLVKGPNDTT